MEPEDLVAGRYRLQAQVGAGAMGVVWRAVDTELNRTVALKRTRAVDAEPGDDEQLRREARAAAGVHHPGVVTLFDVLRDGSARWLVMEYLPSQNLTEVLAARGPLTPVEVARLGTQLAGALAAVHAAGVLHRDVKPGNVLIGADGTVKLTDFGISRVSWAEETATATAMVAGTPAYLAPEVAGGEAPSAAADVFGLGATLYTAVEGEPPYGRADNPLAVLRRAAAGAVREPVRAGPLAGVLAVLLAVDPAQRPSPTHAAELLAAVAAGEPAELPAGAAVPADITPTRPGPEPAGPPRHRRTVVAATAGLALIAAGGLALALGRDDGSTTVASAGDIRGPAADLGDRRSADPCALVDTSNLGAFGDPELDRAYAGFDRCDVLLQVAGKAIVNIEYRLAEPDLDGSGPGAAGMIRLVLRPGEPRACTRTLVLPSAERVVVKADFQSFGPGVDLCAIADAATADTAAVLERGAVARRTEAAGAGSLIGVDACALLAATTLAGVPGMGAAAPEPDYGNWSCRWQSPARDAEVDLRFSRDEPLDDGDGDLVRLAGRPAYIEPRADGPDTCLAQVITRQFTLDGRPKVEIVQVLLRADGSDQRRCAAVTELARAVAARLSSI